MKIIVAVLVLVAALANGQGGEDMAAKMGKMMDKSPCKELFKKYASKAAECKDFQSALATEEQVEEEEKQYFKEMREKMGDNAQGKGGKGCGGKGGYAGKMKKLQLCAMELMELINTETKSVDAEKTIDVFNIIEDPATKEGLTAAVTECTSAATSSNMPFVGQSLCIGYKTMKLCMSSN